MTVAYCCFVCSVFVLLLGVVVFCSPAVDTDHALERSALS